MTQRQHRNQMSERPVDYTDLFSSYDKIETSRRQRSEEQRVSRNALQQFMLMSDESKTGNGFTRIQRCREALESIDRQGFTRSFHQRLFHDHFIRACARIFWKTEPPGTFARNHQKILESNGWDHLSQEILVSTPRRFGKTFAVSMFAAAMLYSTPSLELSIYSTCKRISQKLMRNVAKFLALIYKDTKCQEMPTIRSNMEEVVLQGPDGLHDVRTVNSYPSKVTHARAYPRTTTHIHHKFNDKPRHANTKWALFKVLDSHISLFLFASPKRPIRYASASTCSASSASASQRRSLLKSWVISRTSRRKTADGMAEDRSEDR